MRLIGGSGWIAPALARVNHRLEGTGLRLDFHFAPMKPSLGQTSSSRPSIEEHWWRTPNVEDIVISSDTDEETEDTDGTMATAMDAGVDLSHRWPWVFSAWGGTQYIRGSKSSYVPK